MNNIKVMYFSQFYYPESIAPSFRATENSKIWHELGNDVTIFTGYPNYPKGKIFDGYTPKLLDEEKINGVRVLRSKLIAKPNTSIIRRLENALSYFAYGIINIIFNGKKIGKDYNVVLGTSGVIFNAMLAELFARKNKIPFVLELRDITYLQMQATGKSKNSFFVKGMKWLELHLCKKAQKVVVVTNGFKKILIDEGISESKIEVITNGVDAKRSRNVDEYKNKFVLSYFGTLGISQNIANTFEYGKQINELIDDFEYLIIGDGAQREKIINMSQNSSTYSFIKMLPGMPLDMLENYYSDTQLSVVTLNKTENFKYTLPSKLFQIMGRGIATLFIGPDGEATEIINKYNVGIALTGTKEKDIEKLKKFFSMSDWKERLKIMGDNGYSTVQKYYSREKLAKKYILLLESVAKNDSSKENI